MLEPTEPTEGSEPNSPGDTLSPRRRRRAASRPAGPLATAAERRAKRPPWLYRPPRAEPLYGNGVIGGAEGTGAEMAATLGPVTFRAIAG
ncbi:Rne/Rng family ribonuclease [Streptomyces hirsutus]